MRHSYTLRHNPILLPSSDKHSSSEASSTGNVKKLKTAKTNKHTFRVKINKINHVNHFAFQSGVLQKISPKWLKNYVNIWICAPRSRTRKLKKISKIPKIPKYTGKRVNAEWLCFVTQKYFCHESASELIPKMFAWHLKFWGNLSTWRVEKRKLELG